MSVAAVEAILERLSGEPLRRARACVWADGNELTKSETARLLGMEVQTLQHCAERNGYTDLLRPLTARGRSARYRGFTTGQPRGDLPPLPRHLQKKEDRERLTQKCKRLSLKDGAIVACGAPAAGTYCPACKFDLRPRVARTFNSMGGR